MPWIEANGASLKSELAGADPELPVLVHEAGGCLESYQDAARILERTFRVLRHDQRGFGFSEKSEILTFDGAIADLASLLDGLEFSVRVHLAGCRLGRDIATGFALRHPGHAASLLVTRRHLP